MASPPTDKKAVAEKKSATEKKAVTEKKSATEKKPATDKNLATEKKSAIDKNTTTEKKEKKKQAGGDSTKAGGKDKADKKGKKQVVLEIIEPPPAEPDPNDPLVKAEKRRLQFKKTWPEVSKVVIKTKPWQPPVPPGKPPQIRIEAPPLTTRPWVPPSNRQRKTREKLPRMTPDAISQPLYECATLKKVWHSFITVQKNKMMLQGTTGCNSKKYALGHASTQTGCIAAVCKAFLEEKKESQLMKHDVDEIIDVGERYYRQCMLAMKCYKGTPFLALDQMLPYFFLHDTKYTIRLVEADKGVLIKHPDADLEEPDLMTLMEKRAGTTYSLVLTLSNCLHFLIWGHPPDPESGSSAKTICYIFEPHMLNEIGQPQTLFGNCCEYTKSGAAFIRYPGIQSFVMDFLANYADLEQKPTHKSRITLTEIEIAQKDPLIREALWDLDLKACKIHCYSEWESINMNALIERKHRGEYPRGSFSAVSLATSRAKSKMKLNDFFRKRPPEGPIPPIPPETGPPQLTLEEIMAMRGEDFFLYCAQQDAHLYGRDDLADIPRPKSETILHSLVDIADRNCHSQFQQMDVGKWLLRATRHMASYRYQSFKIYTAIACCVAALAMQRRLRARSWNEDTLDETLDAGFNLFRESLAMRGGPIRRLVLGELKDTFIMRDKEYKFKERGIAVWGKIVSNDNKVFDLCRGIDHFFKESDSGVLQVPGEIETAILNEGGKYYIYIPWPADCYGQKVDIRAGGKACMLYFDKISRLCDFFLESWTYDMRRKPFSISGVDVFERCVLPPPLNNLKAVAQNRWVIRGGFHEGDDRFPLEHRNKQATPMSIAAIAMAHIVNPNEWKPTDVNETLERGDVLYQSTLEHLDRMGIAMDIPVKEKSEEDDEEILEVQDLLQQGPTGTLAAIDVLNRFKITDTDCIETEVLDSAFTGTIPGNGGILSLRESLKELFKLNQYAILTARGGSMGVWQLPDENMRTCYYFFDPHGCDENGYPAPEDPRAAACLVRVVGSPADLADTIESNLSPGIDDSFNLSPVSIVATKLNPVQNVPETILESKAFEWFSKESRGTAAIMQGPRGENSALGKAADKGGVGKDDMAGRNIGLPAAAAFCAASVSVPPPHMHQDHMFNLLDAGADYYNQHVKKTGRKDITPEDLTEKFEMGANTFSIELGEPVRLPLRFPDEGSGEGEGGDEDENVAEGEEQGEKPPRHIKDILHIWWNDTTKKTQTMLLVGDYHQLGVWMSAGGKVVVFDPAPTLMKGFLTKHRIKKGDQLRLQRLKEENPGEGDDDEDDDDAELGGEGEEKIDEPDFVPPESCPVLMVFAGPKEFIDKLASQGPLSPVQTKAPYKLYPVKVTNELTTLLKDRRTPPAAAKTEENEEEEGAEQQETLVEELLDEALGKYFTRLGRSAASVRGRVAQNEAYFMDHPNRDHQDACNAVMGIVVDSIEPYLYWKPTLIDAILKYGDRLYTLSLPNAKNPPNLTAAEIASDFHVTNFNVHLDIEDVEHGDIKAGPTGAILDVQRAITNLFDGGHKYGVICCKQYCASIWKSDEGNAYCYWDSHAVGPRGKPSPGGSASLVVFSNIEELAETYKANIDSLVHPGNNKFTIQEVKVTWEYCKLEAVALPPGQVPDETYEFKVLTAYVETARGRTILRGSKPEMPAKYLRDAQIQSACGAIAAACMSRIRRPALWSARTVDEIMRIGAELFTASACTLGYEFRPGEDLLLPLQVLKRFIIGVNYVHFDLQEVFTGRLENTKSTIMNVRCAIERFFENSTTGILWSVPHAVAIWKDETAPNYYMMEPHACGATGLRSDIEEEGTACVMTFASAKLMAFSYLQNTPATERSRHQFILYDINITVKPIAPLQALKCTKSAYSMVTHKANTTVPATSKVDISGNPRRADESKRKHPPGDLTCSDAIKATEKRDTDDIEAKNKLKGQRSPNGWLVMCDGTQFLSSTHSMSCRQFSHASRGNQAVAMCVMAIAMSRVEDICKWCSHTLDQVLTSGDQLYQDSYLHYKPEGTKILKITQVLRKFYTPGNCVCRVVVYEPRQQGLVDSEMIVPVTNFFREEKCGVFVAGDGKFAVALFKTHRGYYMFDPADRDRYGRAVAPACIGKARACFSVYLNVKSLVEKLGPNITYCTHTTDMQVTTEETKSKDNKQTENKVETSRVQFEEPGAAFTIYGMDVTSLRRPNRNEM